VIIKWILIKIKNNNKYFFIIINKLKNGYILRNYSKFNIFFKKIFLKKNVRLNMSLYLCILYNQE